MNKLTKQYPQKVTVLVGLLILLFSQVSFAQYYQSRASVMELVASEAKRQKLDPALALAIASVESNFNPAAISNKGARGVMQIMPSTAELTLGINANELFNPSVNIKAGIRFFKQLLDRYGRVDIALSHYNGGSRVRGLNDRLRVIPATQGYVDKVLAKAAKYRQTPPLASLNMYADNKSGLWLNDSLESKLKQLRAIKRANLQLAKLVELNVDPYLTGINTPHYKKTVRTNNKYEAVREWESVYRN